MVFVESVYWGDELATRNITKSFVETQVKSGKVDAVANESLIPAFESTPNVELDTQDEKEIREEAVRQCGEANQVCINAKKAQLRQERLHEKEKIGNSSANTIKGRRLTLNLVDANGKRRTVVVPDGQKIELEGVDGSRMGPGGQIQPPSMERVQGRTLDLITILANAAIQVFGVAMFIVLLRDEFPGVWGIIRSGWASFAIFIIFVGIPLLVIPWAAATIVILYYTYQGFSREVKS